MSRVVRKICLLGDMAVGKTSLTDRFVDQRFSHDYLSTIGARILRKDVKLKADDLQFEAIIWDLEGTRHYHELPPGYLSAASAALIVCDLTREKTIDNLQMHVAAFKARNPNALYSIVMNKYDLVEAQELKITKEDLKKIIFKDAVNILYTSAKDNVNVHEAFSELCEALVEQSLGTTLAA